MPLPRTQFKCGIVAEFLPPRVDSNKLIILLDGMPSMPSKGKLIRFLARKGFWVIHMRYRGSWESKGIFLEHSPHEDILLVLDEIQSKGIKSAWDQKVFRPKIENVILLGASFAGPAMFLASKDKRIHKIIAFSPVVDWREDSKVEPLSHLKKFVEDGFSEGYRFASHAWEKLSEGEFYNPATNINTIEGKKIMIMHALDDEIVLPKPVENFVNEIGATLKMQKHGGHLSSSRSMDFFMWHKIYSFIKKSL